MMIREPSFAGRFYAGSADACLAEVEGCLQRAADAKADDAVTVETDRIIGGIVPHAGWLYSGAIAARVIAEIAARPHPQAVIIFGAVHVLHAARPSIFASGAWETPLGLAEVDARLAERLLGQTGLLDADPHAHDGEHSIEVEVPFVQHLLPDTLIVPIMVPVNDSGASLGAAVGRACRSYGVDTVFLGSTDLTHYGTSFRFTPQGEGPQALRWSKDVNDRRMIDLMLDMRADDAVEEAVTHRNACGGGAIAATLSACTAYGAERATLLEHTTSAEISRAFSNAPAHDAVGYAGVMFN